MLQAAHPPTHNSHFPTPSIPRSNPLAYVEAPSEFRNKLHEIGSGGFRQKGLRLPRTHLEFCYFLPDQEADLVPVVPGVIETAPRRLSVPARPARLLVVPSHRLGDIPVGNEPVGSKGTSSISCGKRPEGRVTLSQWSRALHSDQEWRG